MNYLCLDVGGTGVKYALCDENGNMARKGRRETGKTLEAFLRQAERLWRELNPSEGIACSFPGEVHSREGIIRGISAVEQLHGHPLKRMISERCGGLPVTMVNDANAAALGEMWKGVGRQYRTIAFVIVGSGVGGALAENGMLSAGTTGNRAEIGNFLMGGRRDGRLMTWSDFTLEKEARRYSAETGRKTDGKELLFLARNGNREAARRVEEFLHFMAAGCVNVQFAYDPEAIAIGGGLSRDGELVEEIGRAYERLVRGQRMEYLKPVIVACRQGNDANLLGALYYFLQEQRMGFAEQKKEERHEI